MIHFPPLDVGPFGDKKGKERKRKVDQHHHGAREKGKEEEGKKGKGMTIISFLPEYID